MRAKLSIALASVLVSALGVTAPADAACKKFGFTVNDYGKDGPTNDAKNLLDKHIAEWAAQNGVTAYQTGKKSVSCELFLDVILFDEHTCTASANVCWGAGVKPNNGTGEQAAATDDAAAGNGEAPPHPVRKADALGIAPQAQQAAAVTPAAAAAPAAEAAAVDAAPTTPVEQITAPAETPAASPAVHTPAAAAETQPAATPPATAVVETGALQANQTVPTPEKKAASGPSDKERAAAADAAATAAAAAERAAVAAETAANAAKEAAAAAVAASAASKGPATVPPLDHASGATPAHTE
jgi:hypothetical protein